MVSTKAPCFADTGAAVICPHVPVSSASRSRLHTTHCPVDKEQKLASPSLSHSRLPNAALFACICVEYQAARCARSFRILLTSGQTLAWSDLSVGTNVSIYTRVYHLYSCDVFTRHFMDSQGKPQAADSEPPLDPFHHQLEQKKHLLEEARARAHSYADERPVDSQYYLENARKVLTCTSMKI